MIYQEDNGMQFGKWDDETSQLLYQDSNRVFFKDIDTSLSVYDFGGGNGLLRDLFPHYKSVDIDESKHPDIVADIMTYECSCDLIILRYVLHYLSDEDIKKLIQNIKRFHKGQLLIIQFCNEGNDLKIKQSISKNNEHPKYFRTYEQTINLFQQLPLHTEQSIDYTVNPDFYMNRLAIKTDVPHGESVYCFTFDLSL